MRIFPLAALLAGCGTIDRSNSGLTAEECASAEPQVFGFTIEPGDAVTGEDGHLQPSLRFVIDFDDPDGDSHDIVLRTWWDTSIDGLVDTSASGTEMSAEMVDDAGAPVAVCEGIGGALDVQVGVNGGNFAYSTTYDFAITVTDAAGMESEPAFATATTPSAL